MTEDGGCDEIAYVNTDSIVYWWIIMYDVRIWDGSKLDFIENNETNESFEIEIFSFCEIVVKSIEFE